METVVAFLLFLASIAVWISERPFDFTFALLTTFFAAGLGRALWFSYKARDVDMLIVGGGLFAIVATTAICLWLAL